MQKKLNLNNFIYIFRFTVPILLGYIPLGFGFGLYASQSGLPIFVSTLMSLFIYAGAGQYMAIGLFATGATLSSILITELLLNIRHIVYGISFISEFNECGKFKPYLIFALTDETYSVLTTAHIPENISKTKFYFLVSALNHFYWVLGSFLGAIVGKILQNNTTFDFGGIDFALTALFAVLFIEQIRSTKNYFASIVGVFCTILTVVLWRFGIISSSSNILLFSLILGITIILIFKGRDAK